MRLSASFVVSRPGTPKELSTSHSLCWNAYFGWIASDGTFLGWASGSDDFVWNDDVHELSEVIFSDDSDFPHTRSYDTALAYLRARDVKPYILESFTEQWMNWQMFLCISVYGYSAAMCTSDLGWSKALFVVDAPLPVFIEEADWLWAAGFVTAAGPDPLNDVPGQKWRFALTLESLAADADSTVLRAVQLSNSSRERNTNWGGSGYILATAFSPAEEVRISGRTDE